MDSYFGLMAVVIVSLSWSSILVIRLDNAISAPSGTHLRRTGLGMDYSVGFAVTHMVCRDMTVDSFLEVRRHLICGTWIAIDFV